MLKKRGLVGIAASFMLASNLFAAKVTALKTNIAEEFFQLQVAVELLERLGHSVEVSNDLEYAVTFRTIADNAKNKNVYFMAAHWSPLQENMIKGVGSNKTLAFFGEYISNCATGYVIDKKTADKYNIKYFNDLKNPEIAKLFDSNGNGKADLTGASTGWEAGSEINHQIKEYGLSNTVEHNQGAYSAMIADTLARYKTGKPVLFWTWTPYWVTGELVPGKDIVFLQVKYTANSKGVETKLANGANYGFPINSQQIVANKSVLTNHKDIVKLFELLKLSVNDISGQNRLMRSGQKSLKDIKNHAKMWIKANEKKVNKWLEEARAAK